MTKQLLFLLFAATAHTAAANPIQLTLTLEPAQALPGVPVTFRVTAVNTGSEVATLVPEVRLQVTTEADKTFIAYPQARGEANTVLFPVPDGVASIELAAGEVRRLDFFAGPNTPPWFCDERLQRPGTYRLRLRADMVRSGSDVWDAVADPSVSNEAVLTITTPSGTDAEAWTLIRDTNLCMGWDEHAQTLWSQYPDSVYTSMAVRPSAARDRVAEMASLQATLAKNPPVGFADSLKLSIANRHVMFMERAITAGDVQAAFEHTEAARVLLEELVGKETEFSIKTAAEQSLRVDILTLAELQDYEARNRRVAPPRQACETEYVALIRRDISDLATNPASGTRVRAKLEKVLAHLDAYAAEVAKTPPAMSTALQELRGAVGELDNASRSLITVDMATRWLTDLMKLAELSTKKAVTVAAADPAVRAKTLAQAQQSLTEAQAAVTEEDFPKAMRLYKAALDKAESAAKSRGPFC